MKTLNKHVILYDAECPMCNTYTKAFVRAGMLDSDGRAPYQQTSPAICPNVDMHRAVNEIALVNTETGEVSYGISSLFKIIGHAIPLFKPLFSFRPFIWLMTKVYAFISYNRKVIVPANERTDKSALQPDFSLTYRLLYLFITTMLVSLILSKYALLFQNIIPAGGTFRELLVCSGQIAFQGVIISIMNDKQKWEYLGNMMTISFAGALLLLPVLFISKWVALPETLYVGYFLFIAGLMLFEHIRRTRLLQLTGIMTLGWVLYRLIILLIILQIG